MSSALRRRTACLGALVALAAPACSAASTDSAGVLPYSVVDGRVVVLLGQEPRKSCDHPCWTDFVGGLRKGEGVRAAAAREFEEESRRAYPARTILPRLRTAPAGEVGSVRIYVVEVEHIAAELIEGRESDEHSEKRHYCWIDLAALLEDIDETVGKKSKSRASVPKSCSGKHRKLWKKFQRNLERGGALRPTLDELVATAQPAAR